MKRKKTYFDFLFHVQLINFFEKYFCGKLNFKTNIFFREVEKMTLHIDRILQLFKSSTHFIIIHLHILICNYLNDPVVLEQTRTQLHFLFCIKGDLYHPIPHTIHKETFICFFHFHTSVHFITCTSSINIIIIISLNIPLFLFLQKVKSYYSHFCLVSVRKNFVSIQILFGWLIKRSNSGNFYFLNRKVCSSTSQNPGKKIFLDNSLQILTSPSFFFSKVNTNLWQIGKKFYS